VVAGNSHQISELPRLADAWGRRAGDAVIRRLQIVWPKGVRRLSVVLLPDCDDDDFAVPATPLGEWLARRPVRLARYPRPGYWSGVRQVEGTAPMGMPAMKAGIAREHLSQRIGHA